MKKIEKFFIFLIVICVVINVSFMFKSAFQMNNNEFEYNIISKNMKDANDFTINENGDIFVSKGNKILKINNQNQESLLFKDDFFNINQIALLDNELFYLYENKLNSYNLVTHIHKIIIDSIPNFGDYNDCKLFSAYDGLYLTIGAATNSGVVGDDNKWKNNGFSDISPNELILRGENYGENKTGAFMPFGQHSSKDQIIQENILGNASIVKIDKNTKEYSTFAYGVRNVKGIDINSDGDIYFTAGGIEDRGARPISGDSDYLYKLKPGGFYGWPDYSGGDKVDSVRFRFENKAKINPILQTTPIPEIPIYQHNSISSLGSIAIDRNGEIKNKDSIFVVDDNLGKIINIDKHGAKSEIIDCKDVSKISIYNGELYILENSSGYLFKINNKNSANTIKKYKRVFLCLLSILIFLILIFVAYVIKIKKQPKAY